MVGSRKPKGKGAVGSAEESTVSRCIVVVFGPDLMVSCLPCVLRVLVCCNDQIYVLLSYDGLSAHNHESPPEQENQRDVGIYLEPPLDASQTGSRGRCKPTQDCVWFRPGSSVDSKYGSRF